MNRLRPRLASTVTVGITFALFAGLTRVNAAVIFVQADAIGNNDGTSWENAFTDLQDALAASEGGDQIWVAAAAYRPAGPAGERTATFQLLTGVALYGGFAGDETELDQRDPDVNVTVLSGDLNGDDGEDFANNDENSYHVLVGSGTDLSAVLDGFTITAGNANGDGAESNAGGLLNVTGSPLILRCRFVGNWASDGAAISNSSASSPVVQNCKFLGNVASAFGGAIHSFSDCNMQAVNCVFEGNTAGYYGGAVFQYQADDARFINCTFHGNSATNGGGLHVWFGTGTLINCTLTDNAASDGGGIWTSGAFVSIDNSILWGNTGTGGVPTLEEQQIYLDSDFLDYLIINHSIIEGWSGLWAGEGNSGEDPIFLEGSQQPTLGSPAIDAGDNDAVPPEIETDIVGNPRIVDGNGDENPIVDLGAHELQPVCEGDANGDGLVDPLDSGFVLARFGCSVGTGDPNCDTADQNGDGTVNPLDVGFVLAHFGDCS